MANPAQWTANQLLAQLASVKAKAKAEWDELGRNNVAVTQLYARANAVTDLARRAELKRGIEQWAARQAKVQAQFNTAYQRFLAAYNAAAAFFRSVGLDAPPDPGGLSGLGLLPAAVLVPAAIAGLVVAAGLWFAAVHESNLTQRQGLALQGRLLEARLAGQLTGAEYLAASKEAGKSTPPPKDPLGELGGLLIPALGLVLAIVVLPKTIPQRRAAT